MLCLSCAAPTVDGSLCEPCDRSLRFAPMRFVGPATVVPVFHHSGAAARLVHNLKYRRSGRAGSLLGTLMAERLPPDTTSLVPVPRVLYRRIAYGVDQTAVLATVIARVSGLPVVPALRAQLWSPRSAGKRRTDRRVPRFERRAEIQHGAVLIDDVCTTGGTIASAVRELGQPISVLVATSASNMGAGAVPAAPRR